MVSNFYFDNSKIFSCDFKNCNFKNCSFEYCSFKSVIFHGCVFENIKNDIIISSFNNVESIHGSVNYIINSVEQLNMVTKLEISYTIVELFMIGSNDSKIDILVKKAPTDLLKLIITLL